MKRLVIAVSKKGVCSMSKIIEEKVLKLSIFIMMVFAVLGILFGILLESEVILFDGIYSIISIVMSYVTLIVVRFIRKEDNKRFPFGKEGIEPLVIFIQYLFLNIVLLYMLFDGIQMILNGGSDIKLGLTILYLIVATFIQYLFVKKIVPISEKTYSVIAKTEVELWKISLRQSLYVLAGYSLGAVLLLFKESIITSYIDPIILIVFIIITFSQTIDEMINAFKEIIGMSTVGRGAFRKIDGKIAEICDRYQMQDYFIRLKKVGGMIVLEIDFLIRNDSKAGNVVKQDEIREEIFEMIREKHFDLWLSVSFTTKMKWIE